MLSTVIGLMVMTVLYAGQGRGLEARGLTPISDWGENPTNLELYAYFPDPMPPDPAVLLAVRSPP